MVLLHFIAVTQDCFGEKAGVTSEATKKERILVAVSFQMNVLGLEKNLLQIF